MGEHYRRDWKERKHYRHKPGYYCTLVDVDLKRERQFQELAAQPIKYSKENWIKGIAWFNEGLTLEDADDNLKNDKNFINGYEHAKRLQIINEELEGFGREWFISGKNLEDANEKYVSHPSFIKGFNDAKNEALSRRLEK